MMRNLIVIALLFLIGVLCHLSRSEEFESFRMSKMNSVWNKAQKVLEGNVLSDLYADLLVQDKKERELKKRKFEGSDKDGLYEAEVLQDFKDILLNYGLASHFSTEKLGVRTTAKGTKIDIRDQRLRKMLKSARKEGFTDSEMQILKEEMSHYQTKLDEYDSLKDEFDSLEGQVDNSLENLDEQEGIWKNLAQKKKEMKQKHKEFRDGVTRLETKITDKDNVAGKFEDPRVYHLWALAQKSGMNEGELEDYRKELTHFETRIRKAEYVQGQVEKSETKLRNGEIVDESEHRELKLHAKKILKKVDKYHADLKDKVNRRFDEL